MMDDPLFIAGLIVSRPSKVGPALGRAASLALAGSLHLLVAGSLVLSPLLVLEVMDPPKARVSPPDRIIFRPPGLRSSNPTGGAGPAAGTRRGGGAVRRLVRPTVVPVLPPPPDPQAEPLDALSLPDPDSPIPGAPPGPGSPDGEGDRAGFSNGCPGCGGTGSGPDGEGPGDGPLSESDPRVTPPIAILEGRALPRYPDLARRARVQGTVVLLIVIEPDGTVGEIEVLRAPDQRWGFALAAIEAVKEWRYRPALMHGRPIAVQAQVMVEFSLTF